MSALKLVSDNTPIKQAFNYVPDDTFKHSPFCMDLYLIAEGIQKQFLDSYGTGVTRGVFEKHVDDSGKQLVMPRLEVFWDRVVLSYVNMDDTGKTTKLVGLAKSLDMSRLLAETFSIEDNLAALKEGMETLRLALRDYTHNYDELVVISTYLLPLFTLACFNNVERFAIQPVVKHEDGFTIEITDADHVFTITVYMDALVKLTTRSDLLPGELKAV